MGFDLNATLSSCFTSGLSGMRERAFSLGGKLTVESVPGSGTRVTAFLPLSPVKEARTDFERKVEYLRDR
jgi:signal transduction histidine kinase